MEMNTKLEPKYQRNHEPQVDFVPCINEDCLHGTDIIERGTGTGVTVTYPAGGPAPDDGWLCADCAKVELEP